MNKAQHQHLVISLQQTAAEIPGVHHTGPGTVFAQGWTQAIAHLTTKLQPLLEAPHFDPTQHEPPKRTPPHRS